MRDRISNPGGSQARNQTLKGRTCAAASVSTTTIPKSISGCSSQPTRRRRILSRAGTNRRQPADEAELLALLRPCLDDAIKITKVDNKIGSVKNNGPELILPFEEPLL